jgi:glycosyltransferase involved in cell wall biosynthesis
MKIAVDARILAESVTGIGRYTFELLKRLVCTEHEWYLYSHRPIQIGNWDRSNVTVRTYNYEGRLARMVWAQTYLPYLSAVDCVDLFWSPAHRIPWLLPSHIQTVVTIHDLVWRHAGRTMRKSSQLLDSILMPYAMRRSNKIISVSSATTEDLIKGYPQYSNKISTINLGCNYSEIPSQSENLILNASFKKYILFVGTLEPRKNLENLIAAFSRIKNHIPNEITLVVVGGKGWGGVNAHELAHKYCIEDSVKVLGYVSDEQLYYLYKNAIFLAMPSLYEGFGLPIIEAMSLGTPVLTSNCSSMPEIAGNGAILVDPYSVTSIGDGIKRLLTDFDLLKRLSENALKISNKYSWDAATRNTLNVFESVNQISSNY